MIPQFPLGQRGDRPVKFRASPDYNTKRKLLDMPGVIMSGDMINCTWDAAPIVAKIIGRPCPELPIEENLDMASFVNDLPGLAGYNELGLTNILYPTQKEDALFVALRAYSMLCIPPRTGKTLTVLTTAKLIDAERTLVICPALARRVWAREIAKWLKDNRVVMITGRGCDEVLVMCKICSGARKIDGVDCEACSWRGKGRGFIPKSIGWMKELELGTGQSKYVCRKHPDNETKAQSGAKVRCPDCKKGLVDLLKEAKFVITNYDNLVSQQRKGANGILEPDPTLPGAVPLLGSVRFDFAIGDEIHYIRGWSRGTAKLGKTRRERFNEAVELIPRVCGLTATPVYGFVRDLWGELDAISRGACSGGRQRLPFSWHKTYCEGKKGAYGWYCDGRSPEADTDLPVRLPIIMRTRTRDEIAMQLPKKQRQVIHIEPDKELKFVKPRGTVESKFSRLVSSALVHKIGPVVENVMTELAAGQKSIVFTFARDSAEKIHKALVAAIDHKDNRTRMRQVDTKIWLCRGGDMDGDDRAIMAEEYVAHNGAAVVVATIDSLPGMVSLKGATTEHFVEMHWNPAVMIQAEDRPYETGAERLSILYYFVVGTIDERFEAALLPKAESLEKTMGDKTAASLRETFKPAEAVMSLSDLVGMLCDGMPTTFDGELDLSTDDDADEED